MKTRTLWMLKFVLTALMTMSALSVSACENGRASTGRGPLPGAPCLPYAGHASWTIVQLNGASCSASAAVFVYANAAGLFDAFLTIPPDTDNCLRSAGGLKLTTGIVKGLSVGAQTLQGEGWFMQLVPGELAKQACLAFDSGERADIRGRVSDFGDGRHVVLSLE